MEAASRAKYRSLRKGHGKAWLLCYFLGTLGAHHYYLRRPLRGILTLSISLFLYAVALYVISSFGIHFPESLLLRSIAALPPLVELFWVVRNTQKYNLQLAEQMAG